MRRSLPGTRGRKDTLKQHDPSPPQPMTALVVRRPLIDLAQPFAPRWAAGSAFRSAFFDALSMSFPVGEQFFIDAVRLGLASLPGGARGAFAAEVQGFVGQEATHRRIHELFNRHLAAQGLVNRWEERARRRLQRFDGLEARHWVGATAATEHITAVFAEWTLANPAVFDGVEPRLATLWTWHAAEEAEHRSTAFDLYLALGGDERWRMRWMRLVGGYFVVDLARQTVRNLWHLGAVFEWRTWADGARFLFGRGGLVRGVAQPWRAYFRVGFHPREQGGDRGERWLADHAAQIAVVSRPGA